MSDEPIQPKEQPTIPICPHCGSDPFKMRAHPTDAGIMRAMIFSCAGCRKVVSVFMLPARVQQAAARPSPSLVLP